MCQKHISSRTSTHYPQIKELWSVEFYLVSYIFLILLILLHVFLPRTSQAQICVVLKRKNDGKIPQHHDDALCGKSTFSNITRQTTSQLPPVTSEEVSENQEIRRLKEDSKTKEERNDYVVKYLTLGGVLAGCLIILMLVCTLFNFCQRRKNTGSKSINQMTDTRQICRHSSAS